MTYSRPLRHRSDEFCSRAFCPNTPATQPSAQQVVVSRDSRVEHQLQLTVSFAETMNHAVIYGDRRALVSLRWWLFSLSSYLAALPFIAKMLTSETNWARTHPMCTFALHLESETLLNASSKLQQVLCRYSEAPRRRAHSRRISGTDLIL